MCPAQSKYQALLDWAKEQPRWQQDALRRLVSAGTFEKMSPADKEDLGKLIWAEASGDESVGEPLLEKHLPFSSISEPKTYLKTVGPVSDIDRLASGQPPIEFAEPNGITVIFGINGSGKSGYARILKNLCRAVGSSPSLNGNLTIPEAQRPDWEVNLIYSENGTDTPLVWTKPNEETKPDSLKRISVFDSETANIYVDEQRELHYLPLELRLIEELGKKAASYFSDEYERQIRDLEDNFPVLPQVAVGTDAAELLSRFEDDTTNLPTSAEVEAQTSFSEIRQSRLNELLSLQAQTPQAKKQTLEEAKSYLEAVKAQLDFCYNVLSEQNLQNIKALFEDWDNKRSAAKTGAASLASDMPLPTIVGTETWRELFIIARDMAIGVFPDADEPAIANGESCVLCQQSLDENAKQRLLTFNGIIEGKLQKASDAASTAYQQATNPIFETALETADTVQNRLLRYGQLCEEYSNRISSVVEVVGGMHQRLAVVKNIMSGTSFEVITSLSAMPQNISSDAQAWLDEIDQELPSLNTAIADGDTGLSQEQLQELANLDAWKTLATHKANITKRFETLQTILMLKKCKDLCGTRSITRQLGSRLDATVTDTMTATYQNELSKLKLDYIKVEAGRRGYKGRQLFHPELPNLYGGWAKLSDILSEGEHRALALAGFFTEVNESDSGHAIIFDDPVTSFDWERKREIAKRLIDEADNRQVIIFTHDFAFANMLKYECEAPNIACKIQWINRLNHPTQVAFGVIGTDHAEWEYKSVTQAEQYIQEQLNKLETFNQNSDEYKNMAMLIGNKLRITWERAVEELAFNKVVSRYTPEVKVTRLEGVKYEADKHFDDYNKGYSMASSFVHTGTPEASSIPSPSELKTNLEALKAWRESLKPKKPKDSEVLATSTAKRP